MFAHGVAKPNNSERSGVKTPRSQEAKCYENKFQNENYENERHRRKKIIPVKGGAQSLPLAP